MKKIFFSYTLRDGSVDKRFLEELESWVSIQKNLDCYIDMLQNEYNEKDFQEKLLLELSKCNIFCKIDSDKYLSSKWACTEYKEAERLNKKIISIGVDKLRDAVNKNIYSIFNI